jgi:hypothetical protein
MNVPSNSNVLRGRQCSCWTSRFTYLCTCTLSRTFQIAAQARSWPTRRCWRRAPRCRATTTASCAPTTSWRPAAPATSGWRACPQPSELLHASSMLMRSPRTLDAQHVRLSSCLVYSRGGNCYTVNVNPSCCQNHLQSSWLRPAGWGRTGGTAARRPPMHRAAWAAPSPRRRCTRSCLRCTAAWCALCTVTEFAG